MRELSYCLAVTGSVVVIAVTLTMGSDTEMIRAIYGLLAGQCCISIASYLLLLGKVGGDE